MTCFIIPLLISLLKITLRAVVINEQVIYIGTQFIAETPRRSYVYNRSLLLGFNYVIARYGIGMYRTHKMALFWITCNLHLDRTPLKKLNHINYGSVALVIET